MMSTASRTPARKDTRKMAMRISTKVAIPDDPSDAKTKTKGKKGIYFIAFFIILLIIIHQIVTHQTVFVGLFEGTNQ